MTAVIDVGSNSVRLMLVGGGSKQKFLITTRLAEGKENGALSMVSMDRTVNAVAVLFDKAIKSGADKFYVFATAAVRNSVNGNEFVKLVKQKTGLSVDVVSGSVEAELALLGALNGEDGGIIDIGGASTEIAVKEGGATVYDVSYPFGAVSIYSEFGRDSDKIREHLSTNVKGVRRSFKGKFYGVGGTITTLSAINLGIKEYSAEKIGETPLTLGSVLNIKNTLYSLSPSEIKTIYPIASSRADIIAGGAEILYSVMTAYGISEVYASDGDNLEGYLEYINEKKQD
ncbi:MAG: hypothetical protein IJA97_03205 [Clostridia bacterium]|nr:hypothetical protein [Clostridia bacterium]